MTVKEAVVKEMYYQRPLKVSSYVLAGLMISSMLCSMQHMMRPVLSLMKGKPFIQYYLLWSPQSVALYIE